MATKTTDDPVSTRSGYRFLRAPGTSRDAPIVCLESSPSQIPQAELEYLQEHHALPSGSPFDALVEQSLLEHGDAMLDALTVTDEAGDTHVVYFDVSRSELFARGEDDTPWYLPDAAGFARDVQSPAAWTDALKRVLGTIVFIALCVAIYLLFCR